MLPKEFTDLIESAMKAFDLERPPEIEYRVIHNKGASWAVSSGTGWQGGMQLAGIGKGLTEYMREKAILVRDKLQQAANSTEIPFYKTMSADMKAYLAEYMKPRLTRTESEFERLRQSTMSPTGFTDQFKMQLNAILPKLNSELDLFCAEYETKERNRKTMNGPHIIYNFHGDNARVNQNSNDYSVNIANATEVFSGMKKSIEAGIEDEKTKHELLAKATELEASVNKPTYGKIYKELLEQGANYMKIIGPWIPALTKWLELHHHL